MERDAGLSVPASAEVKKSWSYSSTLPYVFILSHQWETLSTFTAGLGLCLSEEVKVDKGPYR
jgi:hypothetical protein